VSRWPRRCSRSGRTPRAPDAERPEVLGHVGAIGAAPTTRRVCDIPSFFRSDRPRKSHDRNADTGLPRRRACERPRFAPPLPHVVVPPLQPAGVPNPELDARREALPHAGNAEEEGGLHLAGRSETTRRLPRSSR
jgi:hypothetical protein